MLIRCQHALESVAMTRTSLFVLFFCGVIVAIPASGERLHSPWDSTKTVPTDAPYNCPAPPAFARTLNLEGYYIDKKYSIIDEKKLTAFQVGSEAPTHLGQYAGLAADAWLSKGSRTAATCVYSLLTAAAKADAWDDKMSTNNSVYMQNWLLSGTALAYLKVRGSGLGTAEQDAQIQHWFGLLAAQVREYFTTGRKNPESDAWNNHMYWAGLSVAAEGIANNDPDSFLWGLSAYEMGVHAIQPDGSLDAEMARGRMALHYQLYALEPLIMIAELGERNGIDLYAEKDGAIHRLVKFDVAAMKDPSLIAKRTGEEQKITLPFSGLDIGWAVPYVQRFPNADLSAMIAKASTVRFWQWGGAPPDAMSPAQAGKDGEAPTSVDLRHKIEAALAGEFPSGIAQSYFLGDWCVEGSADLHGTIADGGDFLTLRNEQGAASTGEVRGPFLLLAPLWNAAGSLTPNRSQIDWSNGTYWARCPSTPLHKPVDLNGTWIAQDGSCSIRQQGNRIQTGDTKDCLATGSVDEKGHLTLEVYGTKYEGSVTPDGNHINWQDTTYWTRAEVYGLGDKQTR
jgi:poly(beta-D-mannuronate) lyase